MATQMQLRGGTTSENLAFTGAQREITIDTDKHSINVHDGITPGGFPVATKSQVSDGTYFYVDNVSGGSASNSYLLVPQANTNAASAYSNGLVLGFVTSNPNTGSATANFQGLGVKNIKYPGGIDPAPGDVSGRVTVIFDAANDWLELQKKSSASTPQIRGLSASVSGNALVVGLEASSIDFRSPSLNDGTILRRTTLAPITLAIPAGATLGTTNGVQSNIVVVAIDNAGTVELAVVNLAGSQTLDESSLINTTAININSTSASVFYSATARAGVAYRVMGYVQSTQAAAGTWSTTPSQVQGQGGQAIIKPNRNITRGTAQVTTSGTAIDFTGIPAGVNRVTLMLQGCSTSGTSPLIVQIGSGSIDTSGYLGSTIVGIAGPSAAVNYTSGIVLESAPAASSVFHGALTFTRFSGNDWVFGGAIGTSNTPRAGYPAGSKTLTGSIDRVRITTSGGTDTFDLGNANIAWEY
ncbi:major tropism determinant protein [Pseudomonas phage AH02]|nr:major tropism determinant protein [Pseudomonas phage AH02]